MTARAEWEAARTRIQERSRGLRQRLLPGLEWSFAPAEISTRASRVSYRALRGLHKGGAGHSRSVLAGKWSFLAGEPGRWIGVPDYSTPPPTWKCWVSPKRPKPIDTAIMTLIDKKRAPRLRDQASLAASGVPCPYWYARAGIISAIEAAECAAIEASDARRDHKAKVQQLRSLKSVGEKFTSRTMEDSNKNGACRESDRCRRAS